jgi:hypothetical protein
VRISIFRFLLRLIISFSWDAGSLALLHVLRPEVPRQPLLSSQDVIGFWDEGRNQLIIIDSNELAGDWESERSIKAIPCRSEIEPPPDGQGKLIFLIMINL